MSPSPVDNHIRKALHKDRLSCKLCQRRKVGCDKGDPCATCRRAGVKCEVIARQRLPRGRNGGRKRADAELKERIGRLEAMVTSLGSGPPPVPPNVLTPPTMPSETLLSPQDESCSDRHMTRYLGSSFWEHLSNEVGLMTLFCEEIDAS